MMTTMKNLFLLFCMYFLVFFHPSFANDGNVKIESFNKSKKLLSDIHKEHSLTFYCQCKYKDKKPNWKSCGFTPRKDKKRASRIEWEHILPASHFGVKFDTWKNGHPKCKNKKGSISYNEANMKLIRKPKKPTFFELREAGKLFTPNYLHHTWNDFLYWDSVLEKK